MAGTAGTGTSGTGSVSGTPGTAGIIGTEDLMLRGTGTAGIPDTSGSLGSLVLNCSCRKSLQVLLTKLYTLLRPMVMMVLDLLTLQL